MNELLRWLLFLPPQGSAMAREVDGLHYFVILVTMGGALLVTAVGGYFLVRYRRSVGSEPPRAEAASVPAPWFEYSTIATLFLLFVAWWWIGARQFNQLRVAPEGAMDIYVTGQQWMWKFGYPEGPSSISVLYVPARRPVRLVMTSRDVIHSFFIPEFRVKADVLPGRYTTLWFEAEAPGSYSIFCTEYCGTQHSTMRGEVIALEPEDYARWLDGQAMPAPGAPAGATGGGLAAAARHGCLRCHTTDGTPHLGPTWAGLYGSLVPLDGGGEVVADEAYLTESMMDPRARLHRGYAPIMPSFLGVTEPADVAAIVELIRDLRDAAPAPAAPEVTR